MDNELISDEFGLEDWRNLVRALEDGSGSGATLEEVAEKEGLLKGKIMGVIDKLEKVRSFTEEHKIDLNKTIYLKKPL